MRALVLAPFVAACAVAVPNVPVAPVQVDARVRIAASVKVRVDAWEKLSSATNGKTVESKGAADLPALITGVFDAGIPAQQPVDIVFVVDATGSMRDDIGAVKRDMRLILTHLSERNPDHRIGVVAYRDIQDDFLTLTFLHLTADEARIHDAISRIRVGGGHDWREHVYAGINTALDRQPWRRRASQHIILMGDAPPHEDYHNDPRTHDSVTRKAQTRPLRVRIHTIGIKCDKECEAALARGE